MYVCVCVCEDKREGVRIRKKKDFLEKGVATTRKEREKAMEREQQAILKSPKMTWGSNPSFWGPMIHLRTPRHYNVYHFSSQMYSLFFLSLIYKEMTYIFPFIRISLASSILCHRINRTAFAAFSSRQLNNKSQPSKIRGATKEHHTISPSTLCGVRTTIIFLYALCYLQ